MKTLFEVQTGSRAYGLALDNSDYDVSARLQKSFYRVLGRCC
jgi:hypothetical protein